MFAKIQLLLICTSVLAPLRAAPLDFRFPDDLSWKSVFDRGFRPKHISGLQHTNTECIDQEVDLYYGEHPVFRLERGRLLFELQSDESLRIVEYVSRIPITMKEGERRLNAFHLMFDGKLVKHGVMPPVVEPEYGRVMTISDQAALAEVDGYRISFRFNSAMNPRTPLIPVLMISQKYSMKDPQLPIRRNTVEPPPGYEWYSLDPKIDTPGPGIPPVVRPAVVPPGLASGNPQRRQSPYDEDLDRKGKRLVFELAAAAVCIFLLPLLWLLWRNRRKVAADRES
jgi:hypothetical protein